MAAALGLRLRGGADEASDMSAYVKLLHGVWDFRAVRGALLRRGVPEARTWTWCTLSVFYCEAAKILRHAGVAAKMGTYASSRDAFAEDLTGPAMQALLQRLAEAAVLCDTTPGEDAALVASTLGDRVAHHGLPMSERFARLCPELY